MSKTTLETVLAFEAGQADKQVEIDALQSQLTLYKRALEMACDRLYYFDDGDECASCEFAGKPECTAAGRCAKATADHFLTEARNETKA